MRTYQLNPLSDRDSERSLSLPFQGSALCSPRIHAPSPAPLG